MKKKKWKPKKLKRLTRREIKHVTFGGEENWQERKDIHSKSSEMHAKEDKIVILPRKKWKNEKLNTRYVFMRERKRVALQFGAEKEKDTHMN